VREGLDVDDAKGVMAAESLVAYAQGQEAMLKKFGVEAVHRAFWNEPRGMGRWEFDAARWTIEGETATNSGEKMVTREGKWRVVIDERSKVEMFKQYREEEEAVKKEVEAGKYASAEAALKASPKRYGNVPLMKPLLGLY